MRLVRKFRLKYNKDLFNLCRISKDLYNQALYIQKQHYKNTKEYLGYIELDKIMKETYNLENQINYRLLKAQVSQQTLKLLDKNWKSYFKSLEIYKKDPSKFKGKPKTPKYLPKNGYYLLIYTNQCCSIKNKIIKLSKDLHIKIPDKVWIDELENFKQVRILPRNNYLEIEIIYETECFNKDLHKDQYASIDLGLNNFVSLITTNDVKPILIGGGILKSINQYYNKEKAFLQSIQDKMDLKHFTKGMRLITDKRNSKIKDILHKVSRFIINFLLKNKIGNLIIGYNKNWKQKISLGRKNNQNFVNIPYERLIGMLTYKANLVGINVILVEEKYTSKCDALAMEPIQKRKSYLGRRIKRGLFQSSIGKLINADINGALNILRKVVSDSFFERIRDSGFWFNPVKIRNLYDSISLRRILINNVNVI